MSEVKKTTAEKTEKAPVATKPAKDKKEKKDGKIRRACRKVKEKMSEHPFWTAFGGGVVGSAATIGVGYAGKKFMEKRQERKYIQQEDNSLEP